jgi:hypothetical protein
VTLIQVCYWLDKFQNAAELSSLGRRSIGTSITFFGSQGCRFEPCRVQVEYQSLSVDDAAANKISLKNRAPPFIRHFELLVTGWENHHWESFLISNEQNSGNSSPYVFYRHNPVASIKAVYQTHIVNEDARRKGVLDEHQSECRKGAVKVPSSGHCERKSAQSGGADF